MNKEWINQQEINNVLKNLFIWESFLNIRIQDKKTWKYEEIFKQTCYIKDISIEHWYVSYTYSEFIDPTLNKIENNIQWITSISSFVFYIEFNNLCINEYYIKEWIGDNKYETYYIIEKN